MASLQFPSLHLVFSLFWQFSSPLLSFPFSCRFLFSFSHCPRLLPVSLAVSLWGHSSADRWIQQTDASGGPTRLLPLERNSYLYIKQFPSSPLSLPVCSSILLSPLLCLRNSSSFLFFTSKSRRLPSLSGELKFLSFSPISAPRNLPFLLLYLSSNLPQCVSSLSIFLRGRTTSGVTLYLLDAIVKLSYEVG